MQLSLVSLVSVSQTIIANKWQSYKAIFNRVVGYNKGMRTRYESQ